MDKLKIGIIGLGTVGSGVYKTLQSMDSIEIVKVAVKNINKPRTVTVPQEKLTDNPYEMTLQLMLLWSLSAEFIRLLII